MEISIEKIDKETIKVRVKGETTTLINMLRHKLAENKDVLISGYKQDHPLIDEMALLVKSKGDPKKTVVSALKSLGKEWKELEIK